MREFPGLMGVLYSTTEWIMRFSVINVFWFLMNIPNVIIILSFYFNISSNEFLLYLIPLVILIPALFFPSTIAMFATARDLVMKKDQNSITKAFFSYLKSYYKKSFLSGIILMSVWLTWVADLYYFKNENDLIRTVILLVGILLFVYTINFCSLIVHYYMNIKTLLINTFFVTFGNPVLFFFVLVSNFLLFYISASKFLFLFPIFTGSLSAFFSFSVFYRFTLKIEKKAMSIKSS
ncbi:YesL family protein [Psychrobacillus sp. NPDC058041]|uniref:YesL family protein n=1 Tax=Psychrobacillus sp. NPDC058041 TaxID=3346310 RepID=UPI0036DD1E26